MDTISSATKSGRIVYLFSHSKLINISADKFLYYFTRFGLTITKMFSSFTLLVSVLDKLNPAADGAFENDHAGDVSTTLQHINQTLYICSMWLGCKNKSTMATIQAK